MAFNVSDFRSNISKPKFGGLAVASKFAVRVTVPQSRVFGEVIAGDYFPTMSELIFFCDTSNLPGKTINTFDYKPYAYGETIKMPLSRTNDSMTTTFYCDSNYKVLEFFQSWLSFIVQDNGKEIGLRAFREIGYKQDYATTVEFIGYDEAGNSKITYKFMDAYPTQVGAMTFGWEMNDSILKIPIEFTYSHYILEKESLGGGPGSPIKSNVSLFSRIAQIASVAGVINSVKRPRSLQDLINTGTTLRTTSRGLGLF